MTTKRLGAGLDALLGPWNETPTAAPGGLSTAPGGSTAALPASANEIAVAEIRPNPYQPRIDFDEAELASLADSIRASGVLQPVVVRRQGPLFELVAGERRWRAAQLAGLDRIPAHVRDADDTQMLLFALVENVQRKDLNPIEKARAVRALLDRSGVSHEKAASTLGIDRSTLTNLVRLLDLPQELQTEVSRGTISAGHARALLAAPRPLQLQLALRIVRDGLSVRQVEALIAGPTGPKKSKAPTASKNADPNLAAIEQTLGDYFATRVKIESKGKGGKILIDYFDTAGFNAILARLGLLGT